MNGFATLCATLRRYVQHFVTIVLAQEKMTKIRVRKNPEKKNKIPGTTTVRTKCFQIREVLREVLQSVLESLDLRVTADYLSKSNVRSRTLDSQRFLIELPPALGGIGIFKTANSEVLDFH